VDSSAFDFFPLLSAVLLVLWAAVAVVLLVVMTQQYQIMDKKTDAKKKTNVTISPYHLAAKLAAVVFEDCTKGRQQNQLLNALHPPLKPDHKQHEWTNFCDSCVGARQLLSSKCCLIGNNVISPLHAPAQKKR